MIDDLSKTLRAILTQKGLPTPLDVAQIVFDHPSEKFNPQQTTVDLFLYDVREDLSLRTNEPVIERKNGKVITHPPPLRVACSYLVTAWPVGGADLALQEQRLLSQVLQVCSALPLIPASFLQGSLKGQSPPLPMITALVDPQKNLSEFWTALGSQLRPSLTLTATFAMEILKPEAGPMVLSEYISVGERTGPEDAEGEVWLLAARDVQDAAELARKVVNQSNPLSAYLWSRFSESDRNVLRDPSAQVQDQQAVLMRELNALICGGPIYEGGRLTGAALSEETQAVQKSKPSGSGLLRLNRLLLADAFPGEIAKPRPLWLGITGRVIDTEGKPVAGATVWVTELDQNAETDNEGRYSFVLPSPGTYNLSARKGGKEGRGRATAGDPPGASDLQLR